MVTQAQSNATANLPKLQGTRALATAGEATATGKSIYDVSMGKTLAGTAAAATSSTPGVVGINTATPTRCSSARASPPTSSISAPPTR